MNLIIIIRKRKKNKKKKKKKKKKKEDNREEAYRSEERGRRDDCGLRLAAFSHFHILFFFFGGSLQIPFPHTISLSSSRRRRFPFLNFPPEPGHQNDVVLHPAWLLHKAKISEYLNSLLKEIFNN